jgi:hypothetical protein
MIKAGDGSPAPGLSESRDYAVTCPASDRLGDDAVSRVRPSRRTERAGVNALRSLLEEHDHLVQEIDGGADHGEDMFLMFVRNGRRTGHVVAIQVKSGSRYKRANGYAIPVERHREDWKRSHVPVVGVVFDKDERRLFWVNLTEELRKGNTAPWIRVHLDYELNHATIKGFVAKLQRYIDARGLQLPENQSDLRKSVREARAGRNVIDPNKSDDIPNPLFEGVADFLLRHPNLRVSPKKWIALAFVATVMAIEWPYQIQFAKNYPTGVPPVLWVANMYLMIIMGIIIGHAEKKANRFAEGVYRFILCVGWYYAILPFQMSSDPSTDQWWGQLYAIPMVFLPGMSMAYWIGYYVKGEMDRKRRWAAAEIEPQ